MLLQLLPMIHRMHKHQAMSLDEIAGTLNTSLAVSWA